MDFIFKGKIFEGELKFPISENELELDNITLKGALL